MFHFQKDHDDIRPKALANHVSYSGLGLRHERLKNARSVEILKSKSDHSA